MTKQSRSRIIGAAIGSMVTLTPHAGKSFEGNQCKAAWNISVLYIKPLKEKLSVAFVDSVRAAFLVLDGGNPIRSADGQSILRPCNAAEKRQIMLEKFDDLIAFEMIEEATARQNINITNSLDLKPTEKADSRTRSWVAVRRKTQPPSHVP